MDHEQRIQTLFDRYVAGTIGTDELDELDRLVGSDDPASAGWTSILENHYANEQPAIPEHTWQQAAPVADRTWHRIREQIEKSAIPRQLRRRRYIRLYRCVAAAILLLSVCGTLWHYHPDWFGTDKQELATAPDIQPGTNRATLTVGTQAVTLREDRQGVVMGEQGIAYDDGTPIAATTESPWATLSTPLAGQYRVTLPDGSTVWMNAGTTLQYPTRFSGSERRVQLHGEAFFEIQKSSSPFIVESEGQEVQVIGTKFNVKSYADETVTATTLVEGAVRLTASKGGKGVSLKPGEQAISDGTLINVLKVDAVSQTAWKDGLIVLQHQTIEQVLRQLSRWYDVEFIMEAGINLPDKTLSGEVSRDVPLAVFLQALTQQTQLKFNRAERRFMVSY